MHLLLNVIIVVQLLAALVMIGLVLIQHGKGADMGASFGSGASGSLFGATGSANFLSRSTAVCAAIFFACTLGLSYLSYDRPRSSSGGSVLDRAAVPSSTASLPATGSGLIPGAGTAASQAGVSVPVAPSAPPLAASGAGAIPAK